MSQINISNDDKHFELLCNITQGIVSSPSFVILVILELITSITGALSNVPLLLLIWRVRVVHPNLRWLLAHFCCVLIWFCIATFLKAIYLLINSQFDDQCELVSAAYSCRVQELPHVLAILSTVYSLISILLERLYSTVRYRHYDESRQPWLAMFLIPSVWIGSLIYQICSLTWIPSHQLVPLCESLLSVRPGAIFSLLASTVIVEISGIVIAIFIYFYNSRKLETMAIDRAKHTLTSRFQIIQNVQMNRIIVPSTLMLVCCYLPNHIFLLLILYGLGLDFSLRAYLIHVNYLWKLIYCIVHPILSFRRSPHLRAQFHRISPKWLEKFILKKNTIDITTISAPRGNLEDRNGGERHFELLAQMWNVKPRR